MSGSTVPKLIIEVGLLWALLVCMAVREVGLRMVEIRVWVFDEQRVFV